MCEEFSLQVHDYPPDELPGMNKRCSSNIVNKTAWTSAPYSPLLKAAPSLPKPSPAFLSQALVLHSGFNGHKPVSFLGREGQLDVHDSAANKADESQFDGSHEYSDEHSARLKLSPQAPHELVDDGLKKADCWSCNKDIVSSGNREAVRPYLIALEADMDIQSCQLLTQEGSLEPLSTVKGCVLPVLDGPSETEPSGRCAITLDVISTQSGSTKGLRSLRSPALFVSHMPQPAQDMPALVPFRLDWKPSHGLRDNGMSRLYSPRVRTALRPSIPEPIVALLYPHSPHDLRDIMPVG